MFSKMLPWGLLFITLLSGTTLFVPEAPATFIGGTEWLVFTPGGHVICNVDSYNQNHGICLLGGLPSSSPDKSLVMASFLLRWRYYPGHVAVENEHGLFLIEERTHRRRYFQHEAELLAEAESLGMPISDWLEPRDGWNEAMFPFLVWEPCMRLLNPAIFVNVPSSLPEWMTSKGRSVETCSKALSTNRIRRYRLTTWGRVCDDWRVNPDLELSPLTLPDPLVMNNFCDTFDSVN